MSRVLVLRPSAKVNLTLHVGTRRPDGFHDVRTVLQSIALSDTLTITERSGRFTLLSRSPGVPADRTNLVWRAADLLWKALGKTGEPRDAHVKLNKQIPTEAGLGGGSADAAAALVGLNAVWDGRQSRKDLMRLAATLGSDVPFFLHGGTALGTGRGEELYPLDDARRFGVVVLKPSFGVKTADAYRWFDEDADRAASAPAARMREVDLGWPTGPIVLQNDLEAPVARRHEDINAMVQACLREGAWAAAMTGSGSAVFGLFTEAGAAKAARRLKRPEWLVVLTRTLGRREASRRVTL